MTIQTATFGVSPLIKLAPDPDFLNNRFLSNVIYKRITGIDATGGLTPVLNLTGGAFVISFLSVSEILTGIYTVKLTIDGVVIFENTNVDVNSTGVNLIGTVASSTSDSINDVLVTCEDSFLLEVESPSDTDITVNFLARPIL